MFFQIRAEHNLLIYYHKKGQTAGICPYNALYKCGYSCSCYASGVSEMFSLASFMR